MSWTKQTIAYFLMGLFFLSALKLFDIGVGLILFKKIHHQEKILLTQRALNLKEYAPNQSMEITPPDAYIENVGNLVQKAYSVNIDNNGFIANGNDIDQFSDTYSIIFFGSSTTEALFVDERSRFPSVIERSLIDYDGFNIRTLNGGVSGNHSLHSLLSYIGKGLLERPSHVVLMNNAADLSLLSKTGSYWISPSYREIIKDTNRNMITRVIDTLRGVKNLLVPNTYEKVRPLFFPQGIRPELFDEWAGYRENILLYSQIEPILNKQFRASIESFVVVSRAWGIEPVLMTQFSRLKLKLCFGEQYDKLQNKLACEDIVKLHQYGNEIIRSVAAEQDVNLIDLVKEFPQTGDYIYDSMHLNEKGSLLVGKIITEHFIDFFGDTFKSK